MIHRFRIPLASCALIALAALPLTAASAQGGAADADGRVPPISAILDSAALVHDLAALTVQAPRNVPPLFSIFFDSTGAVDTVRAMLDPLPAAYAEPVAAAIRARLKPQPPSRQPVRTWIRAVAGPQARVDRPRLHEDQPQLVNRGEVTRELSRASARQLQRFGSFPPGGFQTQVRFRVAADGSADAASATVARSSGDGEVDREALAVVGHMRFRPAKLEGVPVRVWVQLPITFQLLSPPGSDHP